MTKEDQIWVDLNQQIISLLKNDITGGDLLDYVHENFLPRRKIQNRPILIIGSGVDSKRVAEVVMHKDINQQLLVINNFNLISEPEEVLKKLQKDFKGIPSRLIHQVKDAKHTYEQMQIDKLKKEQKRSLKFRKK